MSTLDGIVSPTGLKGKYAAMVVCWLLGTGSLLTWNCIITIEDYFSYLFPQYHSSRVLTLMYQPFAVGTLAVLAYNESKINTRKRNLFGYILFFIGSAAILTLNLATSGKGGLGSFIGVCVISGMFGFADAFVQGGMIGDLSLMQNELIQVLFICFSSRIPPTEHLEFNLAHHFRVFDSAQSYIAGLAASGTLISVLRLITKAVFEDSRNGLRKGAILFFIVSSFFELLCVLVYAYMFPRLPIVKYYHSKAVLEGSKTVVDDLVAGGVQPLLEQTQEERLSNKELLIQNYDYAVDLFLIYVLTLSIFPGFLSEDTGSHGLGAWYALVLIAMFNVWDLIGRYIPLVKMLKLESRKGLAIAILSRFLLIPAFYFTAKYADQGWMIMLTSVLGLTNGFFTVCVLTCAPQGYKGPEQNALGNILVFFLLGGIFTGVVLDWLWLIGKGW